MVDTLTKQPKPLSPNSSAPRKKFLFDVNIFDEPDEPEVPAEPPPPPPPTFSEAQLEAARNAAFEEGRKKGIEEERASRDEKLAMLMGQISASMQTLFASEQAREKLYEAEAVKLAEAVFAQLFPLYNAQKGFDEMTAVLTDTIQRQEGQAEILVEVAPCQKEGIEAHIKTLTRQGGKTAFTVSADESLEEGQCRLSWSHGGALHNAPAMAEQIRAILEETLANNGVNSHDSENSIPQSIPSSDESPQE